MSPLTVLYDLSSLLRSGSTRDLYAQLKISHAIEYLWWQYNPKVMSWRRGGYQ